MDIPMGRRPQGFKRQMVPVTLILTAAGTAFERKIPSAKCGPFKLDPAAMRTKIMWLQGIDFSRAQNIGDKGCTGCPLYTNVFAKMCCLPFYLAEQIEADDEICRLKFSKFA